jgi:hypothetical protein
MSLSMMPWRSLLRSTTQNDGIPGAPEVLKDGKSSWVYFVSMAQ